ncbi:MAG TPA: DUF167 domain-containing protein [Pyrinomonadaceae bacterium]|nr:DUF167 domain-containing protein [Pyrinomonadaceae bacterium]
MIQLTEKDGAIIFNARVVSRTSKSEIVGEHDGALKIRIASPLTGGAANAELIKVLAKRFNVSKSAIEILKGQTSKTKQIKITGGKIGRLQSLYILVKIPNGALYCLFNKT